MNAFKNNPHKLNNAVATMSPTTYKMCLKKLYNLKILIPLISLISANPCLSVNLLPNPSFEEKKDDMPLHWSLTPGAEGYLEEKGRESDHCVSLIGKLDKHEWWSTKAEHLLEKGKLYRFSFYGKQSPGTTGGCIDAGTSFCKRAFYTTEEWKRYSFVFVVPEWIKGSTAHVGYWQRRGKMFFDDVSLCPVEPVHRTKDGITLGEGEKIKGNIYTFEPNFAYEGSNYSRPLFRANCFFNTNRWVFHPDSYVIYKHEIKGIKQIGAKVKVKIGYYVAGDCLVEASIDGDNWGLIGKLSGLETKEFSLPERFFPTSEVYIRFRSLRESEGTENLRPGWFQIYTYKYVSTLEKNLPDFTGRTRFLDILKTSEDFKVEILSLGDLVPIPNRDNSIKIALKSEETQKVISEIKIIQGKKKSVFKKEIKTSQQRNIFNLPYQIKHTGETHLFLSLFSEGEKIYETKTEFFISPLYDTNYGETIKEDKDATIWWCEGTYKVYRERLVPEKRTEYAKIYLAKGEYEPLQIVIYPKRDLKGVIAKIDGEFSENWDIDYVYYHYVKHPSDYVGCEDWWPDALPHFNKPIDLKKGINQPLWLTFKAPEDIKAGKYKMTLSLKSEDGWEQKIPILVHIFDFRIPKETHLESGFGLYEHLIARYHNLETIEERRKVWDLYMQNFREHRISPFNFAPFDPIKVKFPENPEDDVEIDFSAWSREAEKYLDKYGFTNFQLHIHGMGYDRRYEGDPTWYKGKVGKFEEGTVEHKIIFNKYLKKLEEFLEKRNWLKKAYIYWHDEPWPEIYPQVIEGMKKIKEAAPKLTRLLTEEQQPELVGHVDIWCPMPHTILLSEIENCHKRGERVWWYLCCEPVAPYTTIFIDHPAIALRIWIWMNIRYNIDGILFWCVNWWTSPAAFPDPKNIQNPYEDPMAYSVPEGGFWGNGSGTLLYPPNMDVNRDKRKYLEGPVNSIRWEILREGIEDYEYFWLLRELIKKAKEKGKDTKREEKLLQISKDIITDLTNFPKDPKLLYNHRLKIARAIEKLQKELE